MILHIQNENPSRITVIPKNLLFNEKTSALVIVEWTIVFTDYMQEWSSTQLA